MTWSLACQNEYNSLTSQYFSGDSYVLNSKLFCDSLWHEHYLVCISYLSLRHHPIVWLRYTFILSSDVHFIWQTVICKTVFEYIMLGKDFLMMIMVPSLYMGQDKDIISNLVIFLIHFIERFPNWYLKEPKETLRKNPGVTMWETFGQSFIQKNLVLLKF